jgi:hypothetical protein
MVKPETVRPDADHAPSVKQDDSHCDGVEHGLRAEIVAPLDEPKGVNAKCLIMVSARTGQGTEDLPVLQCLRSGDRSVPVCCMQRCYSAMSRSR